MLAVLEQREEERQQGLRQKKVENMARIALLVRERQVRAKELGRGEMKRREKKKWGSDPLGSRRTGTEIKWPNK